MKAKLKNIIHDLELSISLPPCKLLDQQIDDFFDRVKKLHPDGVVFNEDKSEDGHLTHREIFLESEDDDFYVNVTIVQFSHPEISTAPLFIINADFNDDIDDEVVDKE